MSIQVLKNICEFQKSSVGICEIDGEPPSFRQLLKNMLWDTIWWINVVKANSYIWKQVWFFVLWSSYLLKYLTVSLALSSLILMED